MGSAASHAALPKRAGIAYALTGQWEKALEAIPPDVKENADRYFRAIALVETGRSNEGMGELAAIGQSGGAFGAAALEKVAEYAFTMGRYKYLVGTVGNPGTVKFVDPDSMSYRLGQSLFMIGRKAEARTWLAKVSSHQYKPYALHTLAQISYSEGDLSTAIDTLGKALDLMQYVTDPAIRASLGDRLRLTRGRIIYQAAASNPEMDEERKGKLYKLAISQLSLIKPESPFYAEALRTVGWCSLEVKDTVRALASFETAMGIDPENSHEDVWATGRVFERLGFYDEAAAAYAQAGVSAKERAQKYADLSRQPRELTRAEIASGWGRQWEKLSTVEAALSRLRQSLALAKQAASDRSARLDSVDRTLKTLIERIEGTTEELDVMTKDLYRYLDAMPPSALFPKKDRARVAALMDGRERAASELRRTRATIMQLERTRAWNNTSDDRRKAVKNLWDRLNSSSLLLARAEMEFLEGIKKRVSVRERELAGLLAEKKTANEELRSPWDANVKLLEKERRELADVVTRLDLVEGKVNEIGRKLAEVRSNLEAAVAGAISADYTRKAEAVRRKADQYALDEAQALHRSQTREPEEGEK